MTEIGVGLIGMGTIGTGIVRILLENRNIIKRRLGVSLNLLRIADLDIERDRIVKVERELFTTDAHAVIEDKNISIVIELIGGIEPARQYILKSIDCGKGVVTANKALLALHGKEIFEAARQKGVKIGFEASVGGGIPILRAVRQGMASDEILSIKGIMNGTCNYILSEMTDSGRKFEEVLAQAQEKGYAEADSSYDIEGIDTAHKLTVIGSLGYGKWLPFQDIYLEGIAKIHPLDIRFAKELGYCIKLLAISQKDEDQLEARVHPAMVPNPSMLSMVDGVYNAFCIHGKHLGTTLFYGQGAGMMPTAAAVVSDLMDIGKDLLEEKKSVLLEENIFLGKTRIKDILDIENRYYLRFHFKNGPWAQSKISEVFDKIGISSLIKKEEKGYLDIGFITGKTKERDIRKSLNYMEQFPETLDKRMIRIEETCP